MYEMHEKPSTKEFAEAVARRMVGCSDFADGGEVWVEGGLKGCLIVVKCPAGQSEERRRKLVSRLSVAIDTVLTEVVAGRES